MRVLRVSHSAVVDAWRERERELRARGVDVRLFSARAWDEGGATVRLVPRPGEPVRGVRTLGSHPALFVYDPLPLWRALGQGWDVLDVHEEPFALATAEILLLRRLRAVVSRRPAPQYLLYSAQNLDKRYPWPFRWFEARALRGAAAVSVCNDEAGRIVRAKGARGRVETVPLGVDPAVFAPVPDAAPGRPSDAPDQGLDAARLRVGYAGRLAHHKGVDVLLAAVAGDDRLDLVVAGDGPERAALEEAARPLGGRVRFVGALGGDDLVAFYRSLDALAVPSRETPGWVEQFGRVAVEAMACGVPVVASSTGALPDVVGGAGLLVAPEDPAALRAALARVRDEDGLADRLRAAGTERAGSCSWAEVARRYEGLYRTAVGARSGPARARAGDGGDPSATVPPEVVVVAYGSPAMVRDALAPLAGKYPITVVDNSSLPEIREITELAGGRYLDPGRNGGFAAGVNHALAHRQAPGADVLLLNPDAVVTPEDVQTLHRSLHAVPGIASVGPQQVDDDGVRARVVWPFPSPAATWVEAVGLAGLRRTPAERSFVIGSVLLLNAAAVDDVGGFDERFFLYAEETDWAYRAVRSGWRHAVVPDAHALHLGGATSSDPTRRETHFHASQERYLRKHHGRAGWALARVGAVLGAAARSVALRGDGRESARRRLRLYLVGPVRAESAL
ncbi:group 1 glycosyl transferase [Cellulosimicrobium cellulans]|uniref:D-inositol 3-phosphate glycosyltransferase n=1 Tax=Cellulosimicrobium cellulans TaxID=1710 RepID=A0A1Y0HTP1_CELCE|nr:glycosyltransferase [Cellulosimicrobium cellulans]ARU50644.1 group 1 glycosyl transferase [Cellulosimicrobium cellulans]